MRALLFALTAIVFGGLARTQGAPGAYNAYMTVQAITMRLQESAAIDGGDSAENRFKWSKAEWRKCMKMANCSQWCFKPPYDEAFGYTWGDENGVTQVRIAKPAQFVERCAAAAGTTPAMLDPCVLKDRQIVTHMHEYHRVLGWSDSRIYGWDKGWILNILDQDPKYQMDPAREQMPALRGISCRKYWASL